MILPKDHPYCAKYTDMQGIVHVYVINANETDTVPTYSVFDNGLFTGEKVTAIGLYHLMDSDYDWETITYFQRY